MNQREVEMTLSIERIDDLRVWLSARGRSEHTVKAYSSDLLVFLEATGTPTVTAEEFEELALSWLQMDRRKVAPRTTLRRLTSLRTWCRYAGILALQDYYGPTPLKTMPHPLPGGIEDVYRLIDVCHTEQHQALVAMCGLMGKRIAEALDARPSDFQLSNMTCIVRGKRDKQRIIPVSTRAWSYIQLPLTEAFLTGDRIVQIEDRYARQLITDLGVRANLSRHISSHDLRQTFATHVYSLTNDIRLVQELMGHDSVKTTQIYTAVFMDNAKKAVEF